MTYRAMRKDRARVTKSLLDQLESPGDVRNIATANLPELAAEIRREILDVVSRRGGHLASNLGIVELTLALVHAFDLERDVVVWDTGHSGYVYKMLTGRRKFLETLRQDDGCCGFLNRDESAYDAFGAGHAGTGLSAALGMAAARDRLQTGGKVVAVVGDGALGCGSSLEALNNIIETTEDFILVLNDNRMSIAPNVGAISKSLSRVIPSRRYNRLRRALFNGIRRIPRVGPPLMHWCRRLEEALKSVLVPGVLFEEMGLRYIGPLDGHDVGALVETFEAVKRMSEPIALHVLTEKGRGYEHAEKAPELYHGTGEFELASGLPREHEKRTAPTSFSDAFGESMLALARADERVVVVTAGMCQGTGLAAFRQALPQQFFDVGIAEEHAVIFAAGMAARGLKPVVAIYASFMQRAMDYVFHDVCLQRLPIVFCLDRAGIVPDGPTHHGIQDLGFWGTLPNLAILQPADAVELDAMLRLALERGETSILRYPRGKADPPAADLNPPPLAWGKAGVLRQGTDVALWSLGRETQTALAVAAELAQSGIEARVVNVRFLSPFDHDMLRRHAAEGLPIVTLEDHNIDGGLGTVVRASLAGMDGVRILCRGWPREIIPWGTVEGIRRKYGLTPAALVREIQEFLA